MTKDDILNHLRSNKIPNKLLKHRKEYRDALLLEYPTILSENERLYLLRQNLKSPPNCPICNKFCAFSNKERTYLKTCGDHTCINSLKKQTNIHKYGVDNPAKSDKIKEKIKSTNLVRYGVENVSSIIDTKNKRIKTFADRYGVTNPSKLASHSEKTKQTNTKKYGFSHHMQNRSVQQKVSNSCIAKYGKTAIEMGKQKRIEKTREKYGVDFNFQSKNWQELAKDRCLEIYGDIYPNRTEAGKNKIKTGCLRKLGRNHPNQKHISLETLEIFNNKERVTELYNSNSILGLSERFHVSEGFISAHFKKAGLVLSQRSSYEREMKSFLDSYNISYKMNDRSFLGNGKELDFLILSHNLAIEINGLYYHSEEKGFGRYAHKEKFDICKQKGIKLITIFEDELLTKKEIVYNFLKNLLKLNKGNKVYARNCTVKPITISEAKRFLETYHLQGAPGLIQQAYGLFHNEKLASVMTFSLKRDTKKEDNIWELTRFVNGTDKVVGGASKLLSFFVKEINPKTVISFADLRWSDGDLYEKLMFINETTIPPDYYYVKNCERFHKSRFSKVKLKKKGLLSETKTEADIMKQLGYGRIWDCGKIRFTKIVT